MDGNSRTINSKVIQIDVATGPTTSMQLEKTAYYTNYGPMIVVPGSFDWSAGQAFAIKDANLPNFSWGFVENMVQVLLNKDIHWDENVIGNQKEERLRQMIQVIRDDANWFDIIKKKAKERNISVDSMLVIDAIWMLEQEK